MIGPDAALPLPWLQAPLTAALASLRAHATLIHGPGAVGQFELALVLAQGWLCEAGPADSRRPCGHCTACHLMQAHLHPDFHLLLPDALREPLGWQPEDDGAREASDAKKAKPSREIRVEAVRAAIDWGQQTSSRGRAKVIVIHPAQAMNMVAANALLKTLEEPPGSLRLLLCASDPESLLPTVRSRCQRLPLAAPTRVQALTWLEGCGVQGAGVLFAASGEQPLEALAMSRAGIDEATWQRLPAMVKAGSAAPLAAWSLPRAIDALQKLCHDLMARAVDGEPRYFSAASLPPGAALAALAGWARALGRAARHDEHPWNAPLLIESLLLQGRQAWPAAAAPARRFDTLPTR